MGHGTGSNAHGAGVFFDPVLVSAAEAEGAADGDGAEAAAGSGAGGRRAEGPYKYHAAGAGRQPGIWVIYEDAPKEEGALAKAQKMRI